MFTAKRRALLEQHPSKGRVQIVYDRNILTYKPIKFYVHHPSVLKLPIAPHIMFSLIQYAIAPSQSRTLFSKYKKLLEIREVTNMSYVWCRSQINMVKEKKKSGKTYILFQSTLYDHEKNLIKFSLLRAR